MDGTFGVIGNTEEDTQQQVKIEQTPTFEVEEEFDGTTVTLEPTLEPKEYKQPDPVEVKALSIVLKENAAKAIELKSQQIREEFLMDKINQALLGQFEYMTRNEELVKAIQLKLRLIPWQCNECYSVEFTKIENDYGIPKPPTGWADSPCLLCLDCQLER